LALLAAASAIPWLLALSAGTDDTGRFAACTSIIMIVNPVLIGLNNFLGPQALHVFHRQGLPALRRMTWRISSAGVGLVSFVVLVLWLSGGKLLVFVYGEKFIGNEVVISIMAFSILGFAVGMGVENGLSALHRPDLVFWSNLLCLLVTLATGFPLVWQYGVIGAAWAAVLGTATATISKILLFVYAMRRQSGLVATSAAGANLAIDNAI
jgi:O-antigen/teichoic acid export membrane protein